MKYRCQIDGIWQSTQTLESAGDVGEYSSLTIDSGNNLHISFYDKTFNGLAYIENGNMIPEFTYIFTPISILASNLVIIAIFRKQK